MTLYIKDMLYSSIAHTEGINFALNPEYVDNLLYRSTQPKTPGKRKVCQYY